MRRVGQFPVAWHAPFILAQKLLLNGPNKASLGLYIPQLEHDTSYVTGMQPAGRGNIHTVCSLIICWSIPPYIL